MPRYIIRNKNNQKELGIVEVEMEDLGFEKKVCDIDDEIAIRTFLVISGDYTVTLAKDLEAIEIGIETVVDDSLRVFAMDESLNKFLYYSMKFQNIMEALNPKGGDPPDPDKADYWLMAIGKHMTRCIIEEGTAGWNDGEVETLKNRAMEAHAASEAVKQLYKKKPHLKKKKKTKGTKKKLRK